MEMILALCFCHFPQLPASRSSRQHGKPAPGRTVEPDPGSHNLRGRDTEGTNGTDEQFLSASGGIKKNTNLIWYYDRNWQSCSSGEAACEMILKQIFLLQKNPASFLSGSFPTAVSFTGSPCVFLSMTTEGRLYIETEAYVFVTVGIPSLFLIFSVLCLCVYLLCLLLKLQIQS